MNSKFDAFDKDGGEIIVDTTDFKISPSGCVVEIMTHPKKGSAGYQNYKTILSQIPWEKREEFEKICKKILSTKKTEKESNRRAIIVRQAKIAI